MVVEILMSQGAALSKMGSFECFCVASNDFEERFSLRKMMKGKG